MRRTAGVIVGVMGEAAIDGAAFDPSLLLLSARTEVGEAGKIRVASQLVDKAIFR